ncbi:hypothetical protein IE81DRAFT_134157 [Ceraceosorus guamensis]|uniref:Uncharacterized protein n=1 Tax=Ceraceosorus guamensis TaxID=1522189 RepID=A0A316VXL7_9BASI|nr:hypothetical protein IE81DRAFT_134157 [Ceraceosorus guamensis]PWN42366.1 hypothetical protein IE81DRAFT_134157 [Ceraceosorus guamensis]
MQLKTQEKVTQARWPGLLSLGLLSLHAHRSGTAYQRRRASLDSRLDADSRLSFVETDRTLLCRRLMRFKTLSGS